MKKTILVIDDDSEIRYSLKRVLEARGYSVLLAGSGEEGIEVAKKEQPALIFSDNRMSGISGIEALQHLRKIAPRSMVVIMTAYSTTQTAIEAMKFGAFDYIVKPFELKKVLALTEKGLEAYQQLNASHEPLLPGIDSKDYAEGMVGSAEIMREVFKLIGQVAPSDATVMITGESGTGKELVARCIYRHSLRSEGPFIAVNCAAIPENLIESELFGHEKGSFTGATALKKGRFELADKGTIFLDELGDMTLSTQTKVLRVLQEGEIQRVGGTETLRVNVRLVAATNKNLEEMVKNKEFREDLYYRLNVFRLRLPALRERTEDIPLIASFLLQKLSLKQGGKAKRLSQDALSLLMTHDWPGNVRELENTIQHSAVLAQGEVILPGDLPQEIFRNKSIPGKRKEPVVPVSDGLLTGAPDEAANVAQANSTQTSALPDASSASDSRESGASNAPARGAASQGADVVFGGGMDREQAFDMIYNLLRKENHRNLLVAMEKEMIQRVLRETAGNQLKASDVLGISRSTLRKRIEEFSI
jgi:two-component system nitrogen regulation response regulator GlnG